MNQQVTDIQISPTDTDVVVFVHGFGVRYDSRGMFSEIRKQLPTNFGSVLFDFYIIEGNDVFITSIDSQIARLRSVLQEVATKYSKVKVHIVAHSKGCIITSLVQPVVEGNIILLAPPESFGTKLEQYFKRYPNAVITDEEVAIPRRDGTTTHIPNNYFIQTQTIDALGVILSYSKQQTINLLQATKDEVLGETNYKLLLESPDVVIKSLPSDHNFTGINRGNLIDYILDTLS